MAQLTSDKITEIYCIADDFCKEFSKEFKKHPILPDFCLAVRTAFRGWTVFGYRYQKQYENHLMTMRDILWTVIALDLIYV